MKEGWFWISGLAFIVASLSYLVSLFFVGRIASVVFPMLDETRDQVQDLGDLAANTVGRASDTMELVELRVSQAMGQATQGSNIATKQAIGVGSVLGGLYLASRIATLARSTFGAKHRRRKRR